MSGSATEWKKSSPISLAQANKDHCSIEGTIYYLSQSDQGEFIIPAMAGFKGDESLVYHANDDTDQKAIRQLNQPVRSSHRGPRPNQIKQRKYLNGLPNSGLAVLMMPFLTATSNQYFGMDDTFVQWIPRRGSASLALNSDSL